MLVRQKHLGAVRNQQFHKYTGFRFLSRILKNIVTRHLSVCLFTLSVRQFSRQIYFSWKCKLMIMHTKTLMEDVRLQFMTDFQVFISKGRLKGGKKRASLFHVPVQPVQQFLRRGVKCRDDDGPVSGEVRRRGFRPEEVALDIHLIERIVNPAQHIVVANPVIACGGRLDAEPVQPCERLVADEDRHLIFLFKVDQMAADFLPLPANRARLPVGGIFFKIVSQQSLPVRFHGIVDGMPVPVHHAVCAGSQMTVRLQTELSLVRRPARPALRLRLDHQIIVLF